MNNISAGCSSRVAVGAVNAQAYAYILQTLFIKQIAADSNLILNAYR